MHRQARTCIEEERDRLMCEGWSLVEVFLYDGTKWYVLESPR